MRRGRPPPCPGIPPTQGEIASDRGGGLGRFGCRVWVVEQSGDKRRRRLPVGIQTFRKVRESGCYYVDKTSYIEQLVSGGDCYFLSRPRRFGKSLFTDTIKEAFQGSRELFEGLALHEGWDWSVSCPVVRLDFSGGVYTRPDGLEDDLVKQLTFLERETGVVTHDASMPGRLQSLIVELHRVSGRRVVLLVDEYDKPILDALEVPEIARANRDLLRGVYSSVKYADAHIRFAFLTGVSKFSQVSLFSGVNNLTDITLEPEFSSICGYTDDDLDTVFAAELDGLDRDRIRDWYNGYSWLGDERVYNPYDVLLLFRKRRFKPYWFQTGTPKFLIDTLMSRGVPTASLGTVTASEEQLSAFDLDHIAVEALLFQTGYLTIVGEEHEEDDEDDVGEEHDEDDEDDDGEEHDEHEEYDEYDEHGDGDGLTSYRLDYPNREVYQSLNRVLLEHIVQDPAARRSNSKRLRKLLAAADMDGLEALLRSVYADIPHFWHDNNDIADYEGFYASVLYSYFAASGLDATAEEASSRGRVDMTVRCPDRIYLFEFKIAERSSQDEAMTQLRERGYAEKHRCTGLPIHLVAVRFSIEDRNIATFETADA